MKDKNYCISFSSEYKQQKAQPPPVVTAMPLLIILSLFLFLRKIPVLLVHHTGVDRLISHPITACYRQCEI